MRGEDLSDSFGSGDQTGFSKDSAPCRAWPVFCTSSSSEHLSDAMTHLSSQDQPDWHSKAVQSWGGGNKMEPGIGLGWRWQQALAPHALLPAPPTLASIQGHCSLLSSPGLCSVPATLAHWAPPLSQHPRSQGSCPNWSLQERWFHFAWGPRESTGTWVICRTFIPEGVGRRVHGVGSPVPQLDAAGLPQGAPASAPRSLRISKLGGMLCSMSGFGLSACILVGRHRQWGGLG